MRNKSFCSSTRVPACAPTDIKVADKTTLIKPRMDSTSRPGFYWISRSGRTLRYLFVVVVHLNARGARLHAVVRERGDIGQRDVAVIGHVVAVEHHAPVLRRRDREVDAAGGNAVAFQYHGRFINPARSVGSGLLRGVARGGLQFSGPAGRAERETVLGDRTGRVGRRVVDPRARREEQIAAGQDGR